MGTKRRDQGFTLGEVMVVTLLVVTVMGMSYSIFLAGEGLWLASESKIRLQENMRLVLQRVAAELRQSNAAQQNIFNGTGPNGSDAIRFSIPVVCEAGGALTDSQGDVAHWGAPLTWGCANSTCMDADNDCATVEYKFLEFRINSQSQLVRVVLDNGINIKRTNIIAENITDFQISLNGSLVTLNVSAREMTGNRRVLTAQASQDVYLRN